MTNGKRTPIKGNPLHRSPCKTPERKAGIQRIEYMSSISAKIIKKKREARKKRGDDDTHVQYNSTNNDPVAGERRVKITRSQYAKWKHIPESSRTYMMDVVNSNCNTMLNKSLPKEYEVVHETLSELKTRLSQTLPALKAPAPLSKDYAKMMRLCAEMEHQIESNHEHIAEITREIERVESETDKNEYHVTEYEQQLAQLQQQTLQSDA